MLRYERNLVSLKKFNLKSQNFSRLNYDNYENKCKKWIRDTKSNQKSILTLPSESSETVLSSDIIKSKINSLHNNDQEEIDKSNDRDKVDVRRREFHHNKKTDKSHITKKFQENVFKKDGKTNLSNVWALLKNVHPHPFKDTPVISEESIVGKCCNKISDEAIYEINTKSIGNISILNKNTNINLCNGDTKNIRNSLKKNNRFNCTSNLRKINIRNRLSENDNYIKCVQTDSAIQILGNKFSDLQEKTPNSNGKEKCLKLRLVTTLPSSNKIITKADFRRKILHLKFPISILGKDEVSSKVITVEHEAPQFNGLENHIWPFMKDWSKTIKNFKRNNSKKGLIPKQSNRKGNISHKNTKFDNVEKLQKTSIDKDLDKHKISDVFINNNYKPMNLLYEKSLNAKQNIQCKDQSSVDINCIKSRIINEGKKNIIIKNMKDSNIKTQMASIKIKPLENIQSFISRFINDLNKGTYYIKTECNISAQVQKDIYDNKIIQVNTDLVKNNMNHKIEDEERIILHNNTLMHFLDNGISNVKIEVLGKDQVIVKSYTNKCFKFHVNNACVDDMRSVEQGTNFPFETCGDFYKCNHLLRNSSLPEEICVLIAKIENIPINS